MPWCHGAQCVFLLLSAEVSVYIFAYLPMKLPGLSLSLSLSLSLPPSLSVIGYSLRGSSCLSLSLSLYLYLYLFFSLLVNTPTYPEQFALNLGRAFYSFVHLSLSGYEQLLRVCLSRSDQQTANCEPAAGAPTKAVLACADSECWTLNTRQVHGENHSFLPTCTDIVMRMMQKRTTRMFIMQACEKPAK